MQQLQLTAGCICSGGKKAINFNLPQNLIETTNVEIRDKTTITYTPCYMQCGFNLQTLIREMNLFVLFFVGEKLKFSIYI